MGNVRESYLLAASSAVSLLRDPAVAAAWGKPSALTEFTVGGLAGHLAQQVFRVPQALEDGHDGAPIPLSEHYARSAWVNAGLSHESNVSIRKGGEAAAADGPAALVARAQEVLDGLKQALPAQPEDHVVYLPWTEWALTLDDFLLTRMMEIVVHSDDLAASVGIPTPELPGDIIDPVVDLLARLAVHKHGPTAVIRALSRTERAPATISAF
ncbi:maleylpyruvate isomerase N-terminal domain-containing protein [Thermoactinospora rubra]|uniref:maleylpyruvate isomerase N-terminal domain-containing protein n=1 Tax=Thermoactinospora rubra TaxID=1088767 RepID=UPI000A106805|nr:maleylpyruvate isomerase N-terminal domain-containing protein [Thermoactinospora rubra]